MEYRLYDPAAQMFPIVFQNSLVNALKDTWLSAWPERSHASVSSATVYHRNIKNHFRMNCRWYDFLTGWFHKIAKYFSWPIPGLFPLIAWKTVPTMISGRLPVHVHICCWYYKQCISPLPWAFQARRSFHLLFQDINLGIIIRRLEIGTQSPTKRLVFLKHLQVFGRFIAGSI